jgi:hypothetical protein
MTVGRTDTEVAEGRKEIKGPIFTSPPTEISVSITLVIK